MCFVCDVWNDAQVDEGSSRRSPEHVSAGYRPLLSCLLNNKAAGSSCCSRRDHARASPERGTLEFVLLSAGCSFYAHLEWMEEISRGYRKNGDMDVRTTERGALMMWWWVDDMLIVCCASHDKFTTSKGNAWWTASMWTIPFRCNVTPLRWPRSARAPR